MVNRPDKTFLDFTRTLWGKIALVIEVFLALLGLVQAIRGNIGPVTIILVVSALVVIHFCLWYIYLKKHESALYHSVSPVDRNASRVRTFSRKSRRLALIGIITTLLIPLVSFGIWKYSNLPAANGMTFWLPSSKGQSRRVIG